MTPVQASVFVLLFMQLVAFLTFAWDKGQATRDRRRIRESTLHVLTFACAGIASNVARVLLRHKTRKQPFVRWNLIWTLTGLLFWAYLIFGTPSL